MSSPVMTKPDTGTKSKPKRRSRLWGLLAIAAMVTIGVVPRWERSSRAAATAQAATRDLPVVNVVTPGRSGATADLELPGNTEAINVARIYARASGYIRDRRVDIGARVRAGQVLAVIEAPEIDGQLAQSVANLEQSKAALVQAKANLEQARAGVVQARAGVVQAQANQEIAATTNTRWTTLVNRGVLPKQAGDERRSAFAARQAETQAALANERTTIAMVSSREADVRAAQAAINAQAANVERLTRLQSFERVTAPFDGVITERKVERGDLVAADAGGDRNLFSVAQAKVLRIQINVPQTYAMDLKPGQTAQVSLRERPGQQYEGKVARTAEALDPASRTLLAEIQLDNSKGELFPGMYAQVKFEVKRSAPTILVPGNAVVANAQGTRVVTVSDRNLVRYVDVQLGRDMGTEVEVLVGLTGSERLVTNPADTLSNGQEVRTNETKKRSKS